MHGLKIGTISDLIAYRRKYDSIVKRVTETTLDSHVGGEFRVIVYVNKATLAQHVALVKGDVASGGPVLARVHAMNLFTDILGEKITGRGGEIEAAMRIIAEEGRGVLVLIREPIGVQLALNRRRAGEKVEPPIGELRDYGVGAQILLDLGISQMTLLTNTTRNIVGLEGFGLEVVGQRPLPTKGEGD